MSNVTSIDDLELRARKRPHEPMNSAPRNVIAFARKTPESKDRVDAATQAFKARMKEVEKAQAERDEKNAIINDIKVPLNTALTAAYISLPPGEAKLLIDTVHSIVRKTTGVE